MSKGIEILYVEETSTLPCLLQIIHNIQDMKVLQRMHKENVVYIQNRIAFIFVLVD